MSMLRFTSRGFAGHEGLELYGADPSATGTENRHKISGPVLLRDDHIVLLAIDGLLTLHAAAKRYFAGRRTRRILSALDDRQLRDIGLTRDEISCTAAADRRTGH